MNQNVNNKCWQKTPGRPLEFRWFIGSLGLHILLVSILMLTPARQLILNRSEKKLSKATVRGERIQAVIDHIRQTEQDRLAAQIREMSYIEEQMNTLLEERIGQYEILADQMALSAPEKTIQLLEGALIQQIAAQEAQTILDNWMVQEFNPQLSQVIQTHNWEDLTVRENLNNHHQEMLGRQDQIKELQAQVSDAFKIAIDQFSFVSDDFLSNREELLKAQSEQLKANSAQDEAKKTTGIMQESFVRKNPDAARDLKNTENRLQQARDRAQKEKAGVDKSKETLTTDEERKAALQIKLAENQERVQKAVDEEILARHENDIEPNRDKQKAVEQAEKDTKKQRDYLVSTERELIKADERIVSDQRRLQEAENKYQQAAQKVAEAESQVLIAREKVDTLIAEAETLQNQAGLKSDKASYTQAQAIEALRQTIAHLKDQVQSWNPSDTLKVRRPIAEAWKNERIEPIPGNRLNTVTDWYDRAVEAEIRIADKHKRIKATETALKAVVPIEIALQQTQVAVTSHPEIDRELLLKPVVTSDEAVRHKNEINNVREEVGSMLTSSYARLAEVQRAGDSWTGNGLTVSLARINAVADWSAALEAGALEDETMRYKDVAGLMQGNDRNGPAPGSGQAGSNKRSDSGRPNEKPDWNDPYNTPKSDDAYTLRATRFTLAGGSDIPSDAWIHVDTWYTIGPFPNPDRRNIDTKFPPESIIDLDGVYSGKDGRPVRWEFVKSPGIQIVPAHDEEYAIYYAYTELWFDQACDVLIAVGSDDNSRIWINDLLVWKSGRELKSWRVDEGFRRVHFRQGSNRVLYRIENGWHSMAFSFLIKGEKGIR